MLEKVGEIDMCSYLSIQSILFNTKLMMHMEDRGTEKNMCFSLLRVAEGTGRAFAGHYIVLLFTDHCMKIKAKVGII